ncbi:MULTISPECIES: entericidin A/B family lipoprotein [unclassified Thioalkalivibrio]|uniref:entericidin A/B family lipoprotein n=1 Tax=unclassified Thioalkalivibrio TaxID=2621013 RepID=UPI000366569A|nr:MULTISPECIES: entericidin A/B family lipoprotein [unclassified Thioalkalivibrio]
MHFTQCIPAALLILLVALGSLGIAGCATMEGFGEDVQDAGESIERQAEDNSN